MFNELSNFILHCVIQLFPELEGGKYWWIFLFTEAYQNARKMLSINSRNNNLYSKFHFSKRFKPTKAEPRNEFNIFQQEKRVNMARLYILSKCMRLFITFIVILHLISSLLFTSLSDTKL